MDGKDERLDPVRSFTVGSLRLDPETWREFVSQEDNQVTFTSFFNAQDYCNLYICRDSQSGLSVSLDFPKNVQTKVVCVSKTAREVVTKENARKILIIQEVEGEDAMSFIIAVSEEVTCPLLRNPETSGSWAAGVAEEALRFMERQKNEALVMKSQIEGRTFLPYPGALRDDALHDDALHDDALHDDPLHDDDVHDDPEGRKVSDVKLLHACDSMVIEWAELVSEFLQQDSSQPVLDGLKPLPSEEFSFWKNRLKNLHFIQQQVMMSLWQQVVMSL